ncbi:aspartate/glutamate racemase family protein [Bordetella sp. BOR01]|uniref:aspartate/glutamate racemase family protein n=1 Tax=Bordetella sp. BOR01 TaxID=2854779 RepID=UPI001C471370|nr:aspartate/glutamate racemase family protein [Bordetella sp. BOR01]MBV7482954.1 aspartate/glutamate racemase family protein [Bordetella sp. BOR01]
MKIWYQSASSYGYEPVWDEYGKTLESQCRNVLAPDVELRVAGIPVMLRDVENWRSLQYYQNAQVLANMRRAEAEGYDAFVIGCTLDVCLHEGKSMLDIPVVGISEAAYRMAMTMGRLYAVVTSSSAFTEVYGEQVERYGVAGRYLRGPYIVPASEEEIATSLIQPGPLLEKFRQTAARAVADGASVIIPAPAFLSTLAYRAGVTDIDGALVLDTVATAVKTAEMLAGLRKAGVQPSRRIGVYCKPAPRHEQDAYRDLGRVFTLEPY